MPRLMLKEHSRVGVELPLFQFHPISIDSNQANISSSEEYQ
jgi:hypothetical protein